MKRSLFTNFIVVVGAVSVVFSIGGAFNVGMSGFWVATPFMALLVALSFKFGRIYSIFSVVFVAVCILINVTIYKNPWVFPVLQEGTQVEILKDGLYRSFGDGSGSFVEMKDIYPNGFTAEQRNQLNSFLEDDRVSLMRIPSATFPGEFETIYKCKACQRFPVFGVYNFGGIDSKNQNYLVTALGNVGEDEIQEEYMRIIPDIPVQSQWSKYLGNLMYWPVPLIILGSYFEMVSIGSIFEISSFPFGVR